MSKLKISADTSGIKKSIMEVGAEFKKLSSTQKMSAFSSEERKFIKSELNTQFKNLKNNLSQSKTQVKELFKELKNVVKGSEQEFKTKQKITEELKKQLKTSKEMSQIAGKSGGRGLGGLGGKLGMLGMGAAALGYAMSIPYRATAAYSQGAGDNISLQGLGMNPRSRYSARQLAEAGLDSTSMMQETVESARILGRDGGNESSVYGRARFERAKGLESGSLMNVASSLRGSFGGAGANDAQMKLQASILASGIEDAIGPYLSAATDLLSNINENGITATSDIIAAFGEIARSGQRTVEQSAKLFGGVDSSIRGATGEGSAFFQNAFSRAGIGGGAIGLTRFAMQAGGLGGLDSEELARRGYNPALIADFNRTGVSGANGASRRAGAITSQARQNLGISGTFSGISDARTASMSAQFGNAMFGTQGMGGLDALRLLEQLESKKINKRKFDTELEKIKNNTPELKSLSAINNSLSGQTKILQDMKQSLLYISGEQMMPVANLVSKADNLAIQGAGGLVKGSKSVGSSILDIFKNAGSGFALPNTSQGNANIKVNVKNKNEFKIQNKVSDKAWGG